MRMTPEQKKVLRPIFTSVAHHNRNVWWELKREIFDCGFQSQYQWALDFLQPAERALDKLPDADKTVLIAEWRHAHQDGFVRSDETVLGFYVGIVVEEIVRRARTAAYRTDSW